MTFNKVTEHSNPIFARLEFLKIKDIWQLQLLSSVYDCLNKTAPVYFHDYFVSCSQLHHFSTRLAFRGDLFLERKKTSQYGMRSIEYNGARLWNMLPVSIRESSSGSVFQFELKKHLLIHRIIQNVLQNHFSTLTYKLCSFSIPHHVKTHKALHFGSEVSALLLGWPLCLYRGVVGSALYGFCQSGAHWTVVC